MARRRTARGPGAKRLDADADDAPLANGYGLPLAPPGTDPLADLTRALARDLIAAGFTIHDCAGKAPGGGVCLTPASDRRGVIVTWTQHDAAEAVLGYGRYRDIQEEMNCTVADVVTTLGYPIEGYGQAPTSSPGQRHTPTKRTTTASTTDVDTQ